MASATAAPEDAKAPPMAIVTTEITGNDLAFFKGAAQETALLTQLCDLARAHSTTPEILSLTAGIGKDQSAAAAKLKELAAAKQIPLPTGPDGLGKKQLQSLARLKGARFEKGCIEAITDAQDALETSLTAGAASADKEIKDYSANGLQTLKTERSQLHKLGI